MGEPAAPIESPFGRALSAGRSGADHEVAGIVVTKRSGLAIVSVIVRRGQMTALGDYFQKRYRLALPEGPRHAAGEAVTATGIGPGRWLLIGDDFDAESLCRRLATDLKSLAAVADLSDAFAVIRLTGGNVRAVLAKGLPIDLHPRCFGAGDAATSIAALIPVHLWQLDDAPTYDLAVPRSMAVSFAKWLEASAAEFGLQVVA